MVLDQEKVSAVQRFALSHPLAVAGNSLDRRHIIEAGGGLVVALSLNK